MRKLFCSCVFAVLCAFMYAKEADEVAQSRRAVAMLNYLTVQTQRILDSKCNRVMLEEVYNTIINNTAPSAVDEDTRNQLNSMLDSINELRMLQTDREHLQILFENEQAQALASAMPNPTYPQYQFADLRIFRHIARTIHRYRNARR